MWNILGDLWKNGTPDWTTVLKNPKAKLHLYGKSEARPGRKMGHVCLMAETIEEALAGIKNLQAGLGVTV
jgi:5-(carboxyamino)imidazole ribonucleotide synthase